MRPQSAAQGSVEDVAISIGSNIASMRAREELDKNSSAMSTSLERLSSGQRINHASDDAAGLAIATQLGIDSRVFRKAVSNVNDGISYLSIAAEAVSSLKNITIRMRELSTSSSNGTLSDKQRSALDNEFQLLSQEYNRILETTGFNGTGVLLRQNGSLSLQVGYGASGAIGTTLQTANAATSDTISIVSAASDGTIGNGGSTIGLVGADSPAFSADGRYVVFQSSATNLVAGVADGNGHIFMKDRLTGQISVVDTSSSGQLGNASASSATVSADGRYVAYSTTASNLVAGDTDGVSDVFVKDLQTGQVVRASQLGDGTQPNGDAASGRISADGRYVAFASAASNFGFGGGLQTNIYRKDLVTGQMALVSSSSSGVMGDGSSSAAQMSSDGRYVAFNSVSSNFGFGSISAAYVKDMVTGQLSIASADASGVAGNLSAGNVSISADGRYVAFNSGSTNLVANDTNGQVDMFYKDMFTGAISLVSQSASGVLGDGGSQRGMISGDGRYVVFYSGADNLVSGDTDGQSDIFVKDMRTGAVGLVSKPANGQNPDGASIIPVISSDGEYIMFQSGATNLVNGDTNGVTDMFAVGNTLVNRYVTSRMQWLRVNTRTNALTAQTYLDGYLNELSQLQATIGSSLSRLDVAKSVASTTIDTDVAAASRISDADIAGESAALTKSKILQQVDAAILAQANQQPGIALTLLKLV
jgi:flagellin-like hook-associated protein FlgL